MRVFREFMRFYIVPVVLLAGILFTAGFTVLYTYTVRNQNGELVSNNWPKTFTLEFAESIISSGGAPAITDEGKAALSENGLWLQALDASGAEVLSFEKPSDLPAAYTPYELLQLYQNGTADYSVFLSQTELSGSFYTYLIGFPFSVSKVVSYVDTARYNSGKGLIITVVVLTAVLVLTLSVYSYKTFLASERRRKKDEEAKEEWLANITHDLKTPLAPIRGYAELLSEAETPAPPEVRRYGGIILKNALYTEQLVDDLKLTYQLQSGMLPLKAETQNISRFLREAVIDILNTPEYEKRSIGFQTDCEDRQCCFDAQLLRRAFTNILANSLKHNSPDTEISVTVRSEACISITVSDNGGGMTAQELKNLFTRYYRGTSTEAKAEGSGLGMAIARQIVQAHGGEITASSSPGAGTAVTVRLPQDLRLK